MSGIYKQIVGSAKASSNVQHAYVFSIPKSGTIFLGYFFSVYALILQGKMTDLSILSHLSELKNFFGRVEFATGHAECPGFQKVPSDPTRFALWKNLQYYTDGWVGNTAISKKVGNLMDTHVSQRMAENNRKVLETYRIAIVFRNPLDQLVSYYRHQWHSITDSHKYKSGQPQSAKSISLEQFIFDEGGLDSYIKEFYSYVVVGQVYPELILFVPYEQLVNNKSVALGKIISHLGLPFNERAFLIAMEITSMENLRVYENQLGRSLSGDQSLSSERHIRNGGTGVWQSQMTVDMILRIEARLNQFGLSLSMFYVADQLEPRFQFINSLSLPQQNNARTRVGFKI